MKKLGKLLFGIACKLDPFIPMAMSNAVEQQVDERVRQALITYQQAQATAEQALADARHAGAMAERASRQ